MAIVTACGYCLGYGAIVGAPFVLGEVIGSGVSIWALVAVIGFGLASLAVARVTDMYLERATGYRLWRDASGFSVKSHRLAPSSDDKAMGVS